MSKCAIHDVEEQENKDSFACWECGHVYPTLQNLLETFNREFPEKPHNMADTIPFCPLCLHDF